MERLPDEIWLGIVAALKDSHRTLAAFARVCRKCHHLAKPRLYERLPPLGSDAWISPLLVRTLCEDAAVSELVRFAEPQNFDFQHHEVLPSIQACTRLPDDFKSVFALESDPLGGHDWVALFIALLPNLEEAVIEIGREESTLKMALGVNHLPRLRALSTRYADTEYAANMWALMPELLQVGPTTLETFQGHANGWSEPPLLDTLEPSTIASHKTLRHISLRLALIDPSGLSLLLSACPQLSSLRIHWGDPCVGDCDLDLAGVGQAIRAHAAELEVLMLNPADHESYEYERGTDGIGSLRSLRRLRELYLAHDVLAGVADEDADGPRDANHKDALVRLLPASIEVLCLDDCRLPPHIVAAQVRQLVVGQAFTELHRIQLGLDPAGFEMHRWPDLGWIVTVVRKTNVMDRDYWDMRTEDWIVLERTKS